MNKWKVTYYQNIRELFNQLSQRLAPEQDLTFTSSENKDNCTLCFETKYKEKELKFYYVYGSTQGVGVSDDDYFKTPTDPNSLQIKIMNQIEAYIKKWKKEEAECA